MGPSVNLAGRVVRMTGTLDAPLLITGDTRAAIGDRFHSRRIGQLRTGDTAFPVEIFELITPERSKYEELMLGYEAALAQFEAREFHKATRTLGALLQRHPEDGPARRMFNRAVQGILERPAWSDPAWKISGQ
jgi:hypothetical protein